ncbi:DUF1631 family protein [Chitinilyticum piscinae]|uniref:DUF1631 family protein n=1 Tax=Chitinilyticum piscinae TaxID=2866724 RepID=A0A8J7FJA9_9NEIS|nr:DUF1631 family protein [Chitinilyticum piscinae]MBE9610263.1 DUF1631 family protein [Chitinilyticum piscinae]
MDRNELLTATRTTFLRAFNAATAGLTNKAAENLFNRASLASNLVEQRELLDIRAALMANEAAVREAIASSMERLLNRSYQTAYSTFRPSFSEAFTQQTLSLVDVSVFDGELHIDDITTRMRNSAEEQLRDLNIRMAVLFDQDNINERENPFRPYLLTRSLSLAIEQIGLTPPQQDVLTSVLATELMPQVATIYEALNRLLAERGIAAQLQLRVRQLPGRMPAAPGGFAEPSAGEAEQAAAYDHTLPELGGDSPLPLPAVEGQRFNRFLTLVRASASGQPQQALSAAPSGHPVAGYATDAGSAGLLGGWLGSVQGIGQAVRQFFSGQMLGERVGMPASASLTSSIEQLQQRTQLAVSAPLNESGEVRNLILEMRPQLTEATSDLNEQMIIDIVGMLFEFILRDTQVPAEIRAQLGRLQLLVLKSALQNPALFSQKHHPARLLVNRIGSIAQGLQQLDPGAERVTAEIRRIIEALLSGEEDDLTLFARMLDELDAFIARELRAADERVELAAKAMESAESRTLRYARISAQTADALADFTLDAQLRDFLVTTWPYAIERAERADAVQALRFRMLVPEVLWSIAPKTERIQRQALLALIPTLLGTLSEGLQFTPWSATQRQTFQGWLVDAHRHALRISSSTAQVPTIEALRAHFTDFIGQSAAEVDSSNLVRLDEVNPALLQEAMHEINAEFSKIDLPLGQDEAEPEGDATLAEAESAALLARLQAGLRIEINLTGSMVPATLCWLNAGESQLLLKLADRDEPSMLAAAAFRRLHRSGRLRLLETEPLFERALAALVATADTLDQD